MMQAITTLFNDLKKMEVAEYLLLAALAIVAPWSWEVALYIFMLLIASVVVRIASTKHIGNPSLTKTMRWSLFMMSGFFLWNVVSLLWTDNLSNGWDYITRRLPLLLLPIMLLCADTSYITPMRRRGVLYAFTLSLAVKFFYCIIAALVSGKGIKISSTFDTVHHTYMAMYLIFALGFLYSEWFTHRDKLDNKWKSILVGFAIVLITYTVFVASRTGIAGLVLLFIFIVLHQLVGLHNKKVGLIILFGGLALGSATYFILPEKARRITKTVSDIQNSEKGDIRVDIYFNALRAGIGELPFGAGVGDGQAVLAKYYEDDGHEWPDLNTHNIFLDSLLSLGLPGLLLLLAMLALPTVDGYQKRDFELMTLMLAITVSGMFESVLSRQMGLLFIVPMWYVIASSAPCPQTGSTDSQ